ncbi:hypothetical protein [Halorubrum trueperi]|uniref:Uncharacterized protein n=1 Tax=Halorubrum trueperi TaxID=2004704 RepID=A0ABD5UJN6_9EURY
MDLTPAEVEDRVAGYVEAYRESAPFYPVEAEAIGSLPDAYRTGDYGKRDIEWVVRWYFRRRVEAIDHDERRAVEDAVADADRREIRGRMWDAIDAIDDAEADDPVPDDAEADDLDPDDVKVDETAAAHHRALDALAHIPGVDTAVASGLLWFLDPDRYFVVGDREWRVVAALTDLDDECPDPMTVEAYDRYLAAVRTLADELDVDHWKLYMVIQRVHAAEFSDS